MRSLAKSSQGMSSMNGKYFIDTNVVVYSFDNSNPLKRSIARDLIKDAMKTGQGVISYQVIQEFLNVVTRKFSKPLSPEDSEEYLSNVLEPLCEVFSSFDLFHAALDISERWRYSFYDSLIIGAALEAECRIIYSEDLQHNQKIHHLQINNPFLS